MPRTKPDGIVTTPQTKYARNGDIHIAYQVIGEGIDDLLSIPGWLSHIELGWELPANARFHKRLASFSRLVMMDKRGSGASDRAVPSLSLEDQLDDVRAVLDDVGSERCFIFGTMDGGAIALLFAATYPERVRGVITHASRARFLEASDYPWGTSEQELEAMIQALPQGWSDDVANRQIARTFNPKADEAFLDWAFRSMRAAGSPGTASALMRMYGSIDLRAVLPSVNVPVLVLNQLEDVYTSVEHAQYLAEHLPNARFVGLPGSDFFPISNWSSIADEIQEFVTGTRGSDEPDTVFATLLFTDFVGSTKQQAELGDRAWGELLDAHDDIVNRQLERFRGRFIKSTGDGLIATFDGPGRAIRCATAIREAVAGLGLSLRTGVHAGEVQSRGADMSGLAMTIGSRIMDKAQPDEILVSGTVKDLVVGSGVEFAERGVHALKGVPGEWRLYEVV